ncbi:MAG: hypothetical protein BKP49_01060 [Treponema sp. CETP13]|nr:MAG: hypothetical protein BKP49_01060 [Treponema sp. CETP13]
MIRPYSVALNFIYFCGLIFFFSCSGSVPVVNDVYYHHFDKTDSQSERMAVFVQIENNPENINSITIKNKSSGKVWFIDTPEIVQDKKTKKYYCGSSNLVPERDGSFSGGEFSVIYTDRAGRKIETQFFYIKNNNNKE